MTGFLLRLICALTLVTLAGTAQAASFGRDENLYQLEDVKLEGPEGEKLAIGYKTTTVNFLAGVYVTDDGYVLVDKGKTDRYFQVSSEEIKDFQGKGLLPDPLPTYGLGFLDYAVGYSLWWGLALAGAIFLIGRRNKRKPADPAAGKPA